MTHHDARYQTRLVPNSFQNKSQGYQTKIGINADRKSKIAKIRDEGQALAHKLAKVGGIRLQPLSLPKKLAT